MISLKKLKWDDCFSYGAGNELDLEDAKLTQIIGTNGVGKSSIPLILEEVLYNKNSKGVKKTDIPNRDLNRGYKISLEFEKDGDEYYIELNRKGSIKVILEKNGEDISSHTATNTYKTVEEILGIDFKTFSQLVYQSTSASLQFLTATDANRKKFLIDLLSLDEYVHLFERFRDEVKLIKDKVSNASGKCETIEKWLDTNKLEATIPKVLLDLPKFSEENEQTMRHLAAEIKNVDDNNKKIKNNNENKKLLANIDLTEANKIPVTELLDDKEVRDAIASHKTKKSLREEHIKKLQKLSDVCPTCDQPISIEFNKSLIGEEQGKVQEIDFKLNTFKDELTRIMSNNQQYNHKIQIQNEWENTYRSIDKELPEELTDKASLQEQFDHIRDVVAEERVNVEEVARKNQEATKYNTRLQVIQEQTTEFQDELKVLQNELKDLESLASNLEILKRAFSTNGLIAYKIENLVGELEVLTNEYLGELSDGRFTLTFVVSNDKLNVEITDNNKIVDILSLSSGELARVNTATLIAIRKLMSSISKSKINVLFLDEVINVLDEAGKEKIVEVLLQEDLNTYLVSHGWTHPLLDKIEVTKLGNISVLEK